MSLSPGTRPMSMFARYAMSASLGVIVTFGLLFIMQLLIATGREAVTEIQTFRLDDFVRIERAEVIEMKKDKPEMPPAPETPPDVPTPELRQNSDWGMTVSVISPAIEASVEMSAPQVGWSDGEYHAIVQVAPVYPERALARRLEGYVLMEFTVTRTGTVEDVVVLEATPALFERPAVQAALKFKYKPRIVDGEAVEVLGVRFLWVARLGIESLL